MRLAMSGRRAPAALPQVSSKEKPPDASGADGTELAFSWPSHWPAWEEYLVDLFLHLTVPGVR